MASDGGSTAGGSPGQQYQVGQLQDVAPPDTVVPFNELELRREVMMLRAELNAMKQHTQGHITAYNAFVDETANGLTELLRRTGLVDVVMQGEQGKIAELQKATQEHLTALRNADTVINAYKTEVTDKFEVVADKLQELKRAGGGEVRVRMDFIEQHYVPDSIMALETKLAQGLEEVKQRWLPSQLEAFQHHVIEQVSEHQKAHAIPLQLEQAMTIIADERVDDLKKKVVDALKNKYDPKIAILEKHLSENVAPAQMEQAMALIADERVAQLQHKVMATIEHDLEPKFALLE